jgi:photosystem II stability/assembly factor-like uncharacterized protein
MWYVKILVVLAVFQMNMACQMDSKIIATVVEENNHHVKIESKIQHAIYQSTDKGLTWQDISTGLPDNIEIQCISLHNSDILVGSNLGLLSCGNPNSFVNCKKDYNIFDEIIAIYPSSTGAYILTPKSGFFKLVEGTGIWIPVFQELRTKPVCTLLEAQDGSILIGTGNEILKSSDKGKTWKLVYKNGWVMKFKEFEGVIICTNEHGILRSIDNGDNWETVISEGGVGINIEHSDLGFSAITYNTDSKQRRVRISKDQAKSWQAIDGAIPPSDGISCLTQLENILFIGHPNGILRSDDYGKSWKLVLQKIDKKVFNLTVVNNVIYAIPRNEGC